MSDSIVEKKPEKEIQQPIAEVQEVQIDSK